jgi:hypothetical protein
LKLLDAVSKNTQMSSFMEIRQVGVKLFHMDREAGGWGDGHTENMTLIVAFWKFVKVCED